MQLLNQFDFTLWVSAEPLLGPIVLPQSFLSLEKKAWCIVGGESGARARSMRPEWATDLRDQCVEAGVPYFFKQWGMERPIAGSDWDDPACNPKDIIQRPGWPSMRHFQTKDGAGYLLDGQEWSQFPDSSILYAPQRGESLRESSEFTTLV